MTTLLPVTVVLVFFLIVVSVLVFIYSVITKKNNMNGETKTKALDVFVYLGIAISLVWSVTNLLQIVFTAIDRKFIDIVNTGAYVDVYNSDVRFAIASLVVMFPIFLGLSWYVAKDIKKFLYKRDLMIRKAVMYLTLFITICTLIGTLVSVIYTYLGGNLSTSFGLKALAIFVVALSLFAYYFYSMRRDYTQKSYIPMTISIIATVIVLCSLFWSIRIIGTPSAMRALRIDSIRLANISGLQQEILNRFQTTDKIPTDLSELNNAFQGYVVPVDPVTKGAYGYKVIQQPVIRMNYVSNKKELATPAIFELCGTFDIVRNSKQQGQTVTPNGIVTQMGTSGSDVAYPAINSYYDGDQSPFWNHGIGETCFRRVISAEMYYSK